MTHPAQAPIVQGWCPGAHRPMMSGDGLVVRVRPFLAELSAHQALGLCALAHRFGNGTLDLTSRANIQIRGVAEPDHPALLQQLETLGMIDSDPAVEGHRNILMPLDWVAGDLTHRLYTDVLAALPTLPPLPEKMGFAIDTGDSAQLAQGSADFRFERATDGGLILRADGADGGRRITPDTAIDALRDLVTWFATTDGPRSGRMARHLGQGHAALPEEWRTCAPRPATGASQIGPHTLGHILGAPFGRIQADQLTDLIEQTRCTKIRLTLGRTFLLIGDAPQPSSGFVTRPNRRLMAAHACPGAPFCPQATVATREIATTLAETLPQNATLHVSGCAKGCALPRPASHVLVGRDGAFDLVTDGAPWEEPCQRGLRPETLTDLSKLT